MAGPPFPDGYLMGRVVSRSPLVTISTVSPEAPVGLASVAADLIGETPGFHLLDHSGHLDQGSSRWISEAVARARADHPQSEYLMLAANDRAALTYTGFGQPAIVASDLIFTDERIWRPLPNVVPKFDAVYVGRLDPYKRHHLAAGVRSLLLIYAHELAKSGGGYQRTRAILPNAVFANHVAGQGRYEFLDADRVVALLAQSRVALCLSAVEGPMRASMECLLSGLPVVSTRSEGGRDRYFVGSYCRVVDDDPDAIARAVDELKSLNLDRQRIRDHVGQLIAFDRYNFLLTLNRLIETRFGVANLFPTFEPFVGSLTVFETAATLYERARAYLAGG